MKPKALALLSVLFKIFSKLSVPFSTSSFDLNFLKLSSNGAKRGGRMMMAHSGCFWKTRPLTSSLLNDLLLM